MGLKFWAKAGQAGVLNYHPLIHHLVDTAEVAKQIVKDYLSEAVVERLSEGLKLERDALMRWCSFLAGSHDLGKVCPSFQLQLPELGKEIVLGEIYERFRQVQKVPHGTVTAKTLPEFLQELGMGMRLAQHFAKITGGHHGFFPTSKEIQELDSEGMGDDPIWNNFRKEVFIQLQDYTGLQSRDLPQECSNAAAIILAGLSTVADWIASNTNYFPYANDLPLSEYVKNLPDKVRQALYGMGWQKPIKKSGTLSFANLFNGLTPRPLQQTTIDLSHNLTSPCLVNGYVSFQTRTQSPFPQNLR